MIESVVRLSSITVMELMKPRPEMAALPSDSSYDQVLKLIQEKSYSRVPVYEESPDEIIGVLYVKDFLQVRPETWKPEMLRGMVREPYYVPESKRARDLFLEFRQRRLHLAIVVDEYGGVSGLVTLTDLLEEIVGDIVKIGTDEPDFQPLGRGRALVKGRITLEHFNRAFQMAIEDDEVVTLAGHLTRRLGRIPNQGERLEISDARFLVTSAAPTHIEEMIVEFPFGTGWRIG
jgi:magnesium and cobalt transporter